MSLLSGLLDPPIRTPAACLIEIGQDRTNPGALNALVKTVDIITSRKEAAAATILFEDRRTEDGSFMVADSGLFERWQPIRLTADFETYREEILRGYVTGLKPNFPASGGEVTFEVQILDESALLDREHQRVIWGRDEDITDNTIAATLLGDSPISLDVTSDEGAKGTAIAQDGTALKFLRNRAEAVGYEMIFTPGTLYFGPKRLEGQAQPAIKVYAGRDTNCLSFNIEDDGLKPDAVIYEAAPATDTTAADTETLTPALTALGGSPAANEGSALSQPFVQRLKSEGDEGAEIARVRAQAMVDDASFKLKANGELDGALYGHVLRPGLLVEVDGTGQRYGGLYYTDKVTHQFSETGYRQQFELMRNATGESGGPLDAASGPLKRGLSALSSLI